MFKTTLPKFLSNLKFSKVRRKESQAKTARLALLRSIGQFEFLECRAMLAAAFPEFVDPHPASGNQFGSSVVALSTGNVVITSPNDDVGGSDAGAVYLFNGATGALISTLIGSHPNDHIGGSGVKALTNGNYVISSNQWDNGAVADVGAVTWGSGTIGVSGTVGVSNSLVGSKSNDSLNFGVTTLSNGNYVVVSPSWDNNTVVDAGAVTFGSGTTGISGAISTTNSLVGSTASDSVGGTGVTILTNGNYVVRSSNWDNAAIVNAGAVTFGSGASGIVGTITSVNSLIGSTANDQVGNISVTALINGNYVVASSIWDSGTIVNAGAVTFGSGSVGVKGAISSANSLIGGTASDFVGGNGVTALTNGNYVVASASWDSGAIVNAGAVTFGDGVSGAKGTINTTNSLVGSTANDGIGNRSVTALTNGNYVVSSGNWDNGATANTGAVTFGSGSTGVSGIVSATNSLVGTTASDFIGDTVTALSNGNYVVASLNWDKGTLVDAGAVTFGSGLTGVKGAVSASNSLTGNTANDQVGFGGVYALSNGNYVVGSPRWDSGIVVNAGAATFGSGTGVTGIISSANSLVGTTANDGVGDSVTALTNGNYVVRSSAWNNGAATSAGAATFGNGTTGISGAVSATNSLVGSKTNDSVGNIGFTGVFALSNGNYVVQSGDWDNGSISNAGAVTFGNGTTGINGVITSLNSLVGGSPEDHIGNFGINTLANGNYVVNSLAWDNGTNIDVGAVTFGNGLAGVSGSINTTNSVIGRYGVLITDNVNRTFTFTPDVGFNSPIKVGSQVNGYVVFGSPNIFQSIAPPNTVTSTSNANFGTAVASSSAYYVVGAPNVAVGGTNQIGQGFVFSSVTGQLLRTLNNPSTASLASMGQSVAITGDTVVLGAPYANVGSISAGRAMLFSAATGSLIVTIDNPTPATDDSFGYTVAASGNFIAIAADRDDTNGTNSGAVYIYNGSGVLQRTILNPFPTTGGIFGRSLSLDGTTLAIGSGSANVIGEVYLYDVTTGVRQRTISNPASSSTDRFGDAVAVSGKKVAIGSYNALVNGVRAGSVRIYDVTTGTLLQTFTAPTPILNDQFGFSLSFDSPFLAVGAPQTDIGGVNDVGAAYVFDVSTGLMKGGLSNPTPDSTDKFGTSVSISDSKILVGSPNDDTKAGDQGYVHIFSMVPPYTSTLTGNSVPENSPAGTVVGSFSSSATANSPVTYALVTGTGSADNSKFSIVGNQLKTNAVLDFESQSTYSILVEATDNLGIKSRSNWSVNATNVNEAPTQLTLSKSTINELQPANSLVGTFSTTDPDVGDTFAYQLTAASANDNAAFSMVGNELRSNLSFDYEAKDLRWCRNSGRA